MEPATTANTQPDQPLFDMPVLTSDRDQYWTPQWVFEALGLTFDLDPACPVTGPPHVPATAWYSHVDDGLAQPWHGRVWCNPPFSKPHPWWHRFYEHGNGIFLCCVTKGRWFNHAWTHAHAITLLPSNMKFDQGGIFMPTVLIALGDDCATALRNSGIGLAR